MGNAKPANFSFASKPTEYLVGSLRGEPSAGFGPRQGICRSPRHGSFSIDEPLLEDLGEIDFNGIHWVIVGGESGPGARPMAAAWVRKIRAQCREANVAFFFKQWGGVRKSLAGRKLDGRTYDEFPERELVAVPEREDRLELISETEPMELAFA